MGRQRDLMSPTVTTSRSGYVAKKNPFIECR